MLYNVSIHVHVCIQLYRLLCIVSVFNYPFETILYCIYTNQGIQLYNTPTCTVVYIPVIVYFSFRPVDYTCSITDDVLLLPGPVLPGPAMAYLWKLLPGLDPLAVDLHHPDRPSPAHLYQAHCMKTIFFPPFDLFESKL